MIGVKQLVQYMDENNEDYKRYKNRVTDLYYLYYEETDKAKQYEIYGAITLIVYPLIKEYYRMCKELGIDVECDELAEWMHGKTQTLGSVW